MNNVRQINKRTIDNKQISFKVSALPVAAPIFSTVIYVKGHAFTHNTHNGPTFPENLEGLGFQFSLNP